MRILCGKCLRLWAPDRVADRAGDGDLGQGGLDGVGHRRVVRAAAVGVAQLRLEAAGDLARAPVRRSSFDRDTGLFDSTPRRFSTGAELMPMPSSLQPSAPVHHDGDWESKGSGSCTPKDQGHRSAAAARFDMCASTPSIARLAALTSPCYFHKRFGDAVNIQKVLEEIQGDDQLSHSRLMQTAAGVREVSRQLQKKPLKRAVRNTKASFPKTLWNRRLPGFTMSSVSTTCTLRPKL